MTTIVELNGYPKGIRQTKHINGRESRPAAELNRKSNAERSGGCFDRQDSIELSETAKTVSTKISDAKKYISDINRSGLSKQHLNTIKQRINSGFYNNADVTSKVTDMLVESTLTDKAAIKPAINDNASPTDHKSAALQKIQVRIEKGFYDSDEVSNRTVNNIINSDYI